MYPYLDQTYARTALTDRRADAARWHTRGPGRRVVRTSLGAALLTVAGSLQRAGRRLQPTAPCPPVCAEA